MGKQSPRQSLAFAALTGVEPSGVTVIEGSTAQASTTLTTAGGYTLSGVIEYGSDAVARPAVLLIGGSGPTERDAYTRVGSGGHIVGERVALPQGRAQFAPLLWRRLAGAEDAHAHHARSAPGPTWSRSASTSPLTAAPPASAMPAT